MGVIWLLWEQINLLLLSNWRWHLPKLVHFVDEGYISRFDLAAYISDNYLSKKIENCSAISFSELNLPEPRSNDTRMISKLTWSQPFSRPDNIYDVIRSQCDVLQSRGVFNA